MKQPAPCVSCGRGFCQECKKCRKGKCHPEISQTSLEEENGSSENFSFEQPGGDEPRRRKSARENLRDPKSTGRKRAARLYPLDRSAPCEWRGLRNCGGGLRPIIGCLDGNQQHRHHGPVKETTRNELGNVHRICDDCHNHWHELNDLVYDESQYNLLPHQPIPATDADIVKNVMDWKSGSMGRRFKLASTEYRTKGASDGD